MYIVASDYDGTLYIDKSIDPLLIESIQRFREKGNKFCLCTGRPIESIHEQLTIHGIPYDFIIGMNGSVGVDTNHEEIFGVNMDTKDVYKIKTILENHGFKSYSVSDGYTNLFIEHDNILHDEFDKLTVSGIRGFYVLLDSPEQAKNLSDWINDNFPNASFKAYPNRDYVSISVKGAHKANGIRNMLEVTKWEGQVLTFGDDYNDIPMLKAFESYGIESGVDEAIVFAKNIVSSVQTVLDNL